METNKILPNTLTAEDRAVMETSNDALLTKVYFLTLFLILFKQK
jgi:hypothetical protein